MALLYLFTMNAITYIWALSDFMERLGVLNFAIFYNAVLITYWIIVIESFMQKSSQMRFWKIHGQLNSLEQSNSMKLIFSIQFSIHLILFVIMLFVSAQDKNTTDYSIIIYYFLLFVCNNRLFYFLLYLKLIKLELQRISQTLESSHIYAKRSHYQNVLKYFCSKYQRIHELTTCINVFFGWSNFAAILICFYTLLAYLNWIYQLIDGQFIGHGLFNHVCFLLWVLDFIQAQIVGVFFSDYFILLNVLRLFYTLLIIFYLFYDACQCRKMVILEFGFNSEYLGCEQMKRCRKFSFIRKERPFFRAEMFQNPANICCLCIFFIWKL